MKATVENLMSNPDKLRSNFSTVQDISAEDVSIEIKDLQEEYFEISEGVSFNNNIGVPAEDVSIKMKDIQKNCL